MERTGVKQDAAARWIWRVPARAGGAARARCQGAFRRQRAAAAVCRCGQLLIDVCWRCGVPSSSHEAAGSSEVAWKHPCCRPCRRLRSGRQSKGWAAACRARLAPRRRRCRHRRRSAQPPPPPPWQPRASAMAQSLPPDALLAVFSAAAPPRAGSDEGSIDSWWQPRTVLSLAERARAQVGGPGHLPRSTVGLAGMRGPRGSVAASGATRTGRRQDYLGFLNPHATQLVCKHWRAALAAEPGTFACLSVSTAEPGAGWNPARSQRWRRCRRCCRRGARWRPSRPRCACGEAQRQRFDRFCP